MIIFAKNSRFSWQRSKNKKINKKDYNGNRAGTGYSPVKGNRDNQISGQWLPKYVRSCPAPPPPQPSPTRPTP